MVINILFEFPLTSVRISASYLQEVLKVAAQAHLSDNTHLVVILQNANIPCD